MKRLLLIAVCCSYTLTGICQQTKPAKQNKTVHPAKAYQQAQPDPQAKPVMVGAAKDPVLVEGTLTVPTSGNINIGLVLVTGITGEYPNTWRISHLWLKSLTEALNQMGITVFRYAPNAQVDPAEEAMAALSYLKSRKDLNLSKVGLLGHAQGGETIAIVAARTIKADFLISLAGVATGERVEKYIPKIRVPVLAISGNKDFVLPAGPNLKNWKDLSQIGGNRKVRTAEFIGLNHYLSYCYSCGPQEYAERKQQLAPDVLREISRWLKQEISGK
jgi:pimeloyl-ACP methyl ester carboxylesterase